MVSVLRELPVFRKAVVERKTSADNYQREELIWQMGRGLE